jgi:heme exporter protein B
VNGPRVALAVLRKDLLHELRSGDRVFHMAFFSALLVLVLSIVLPDRTPATRNWIPALLWIVFLFTSLLGLRRSFQAETEGGAVALLVQVPCDRGWVGLGKAAANGIALLGVELWTALLAAVFLDVNWANAMPDVLVVGLLGGLGLATVGTLLSAVACWVRFGEFLFPVLLIPLVLPVLVLSSRMTADSLDGLEIGYRAILAFYDWVFVLVLYFAFDYVLED